MKVTNLGLLAAFVAIAGVLHGQPPPAYAAYLNQRAVGDLDTLFSAAQDPAQWATFVFVRIAPDWPPIQDPKSPGVVPAPVGKFQFLNPLDLTKPVKSVPYEFSWGLFGMNYSAMRIFQANFSTLAMCEIPSSAIFGGVLTVLPKKVLLVPDPWLADWAKLLATPNVTALFKPGPPPAGLHFATKPAVAIYGFTLAHNDMTQFKTDYPGLLAASDLYAGALLTRLLLVPVEAAKYQAAETLNVYKGHKSYDGNLALFPPPPSLKVVPGHVPTDEEKIAALTGDDQAADKALQEAWLEIRQNIQNNTTKPAILAALTLGIQCRQGRPMEDADQANEALALIKAKVKAGDPAWAEVEKLLATP